MTPQEYTQEYARDYFQDCLEDCPPCPVRAECDKVTKQKGYNKTVTCEEKKMSYDRNNNTESQKRCAMESALYMLGDTVDKKLSEKFGLRDLPSPRTVQEFETRLKAGEYVIERDHYSDYPKLRWRLPNTVQDRDGYAEAWRKFTDARDKVLLKIAVADLPEALKAVEDLRDTDLSVYYS